MNKRAKSISDASPDPSSSAGNNITEEINRVAAENNFSLRKEEDVQELMKKLAENDTIPFEAYAVIVEIVKYLFSRENPHASQKQE